MTVQEMRDRRVRLANEAGELLTRAREAGRDLTADETSQFDAAHGEVEALGGRIRREEQSERMLAELGAGGGRQSDPVGQGQQQRSGGAGGARQVGSLTELQRASGLQAWFLAGSDVDRTPLMVDAARACGMNLDQRRIRIALPSQTLRSFRPDAVEAWERRALSPERRDLTSAFASPDSGGHYTVPNETMRALETALLQFGGMRRWATILRTTTGADMEIPTANDTGNEGAIIGEGGEVTELDPDFNQLVLGSFKYTSKMIKVSVEFLQDSSINVAERIGAMLGERIGRIVNRHATVGTGSNQPRGLTVAATLGATSATATTITYDNLVALEHSVDPAYRSGPGVGFMFHDNTLRILKQIKIPQFSGDTQGMPLWKMGMTAGDPDTINGYPYQINQHMPLPTSGLRSVTFGDHSKMIIRDVRDVTLLRLDERFAEFHQVAFLAVSRHDADLLDAGTNPVKYLIQA
jgi:HK97 family phage major capsid protein